MAIGRLPLIVGNWKMYKTIDETVAFIGELMPLVSDDTVRAWLAVPFTSIQAAAEKAEGSRLVIGAQNMNDASEGAFTGEIGAKMLLNAGAKFVILGHSERRKLFNESSQFVNRKLKRALAEGLTPIVCVGETLQEHELGKEEEILRTQLLETLADIPADKATSLIVAYEPIWAIGTGHPPTPEGAQKSHQFCRTLFEELWGKEVADLIPIQYGGSVNPGNAKEFMSQPDIDGLLVGGASLSPQSFSQIIHFNSALDARAHTII